MGTSHAVITNEHTTSLEADTKSKVKPVKLTLAAPATLPLYRIRLDGGTQTRAKLSDATIAEYSEHLASLPPVTVFDDGEHVWLADGFHRVKAFQLAKRAKIPVDLREGTRRDALLFAVGCNAAHGLRRSNADKRRSVAVLLRDPEWSRWSDRELAKRAGVSNKFVSTLRADLATVNGTQLEPRKGRDGKVRKAPKAASKPAQKAAEPSAPSDWVCPNCGHQDGADPS